MKDDGRRKKESERGRGREMFEMKAKKSDGELGEGQKEQRGWVEDGRRRVREEREGNV